MLQIYLISFVILFSQLITECLSVHNCVQICLILLYFNHLVVPELKLFGHALGQPDLKIFADYTLFHYLIHKVYAFCSFSILSESQITVTKAHIRGRVIWG